MDNTQKRITISQAANIAKDIAIAKYGSMITVEDVAALVEEVYLKVFKGAAADTYRNSEPKDKVLTASDSIDDIIKALKGAKDPLKFRNDNLEVLSNLNTEDKKKILTALEG